MANDLPAREITLFVLGGDPQIEKKSVEREGRILDGVCSGCSPYRGEHRLQDR
jgi:hypothetical protein